MATFSIETESRMSIRGNGSRFTVRRSLLGVEQHVSSARRKLFPCCRWVRKIVGAAAATANCEL
jgi:hypothetical protein